VAVKSIIDIQVNDGEFKRFHALFQQYQKHLNATPLAWNKIAQAQGKSTKAFEELVALEIQSLGHAKMMQQVQAAAARLTRTNADSWREMGRNTKEVAGNIRDMTSSLLKWASLTTVFSGLIGAGGLFGITRMAEGVAAGRRSSLGLGVGYGEQKAFKNSFDRIIDADSFLSNINEAMHSATGKASLFGVGLKSGDLGGSTADVGVKFLERARALAKSSSPDFDAETMRARGIDKHMSLQDFQRLRSTSDDEFNNLKGRFGRNTGAFGVGSPDQLAYQNFVTTIDEAGDKLNAVFVRGLVPLIPGLEKLSTATVEAVKAFLEAPQLKKWIEGAGEGLKTFATYVGTDDFQDKVKKFVWGIGVIADKIVSIVSWFGGGDFDPKHPTSAEKNLGGGNPQSSGEAKANAWLNYIFPTAKYGPMGDGSMVNGVRVKGGAGYVDPGLGALAARIQNDIPGIKRATAFNDDYHKGTNSAHNDNRAFDITLDDPAQSAVIAMKIRAELAKLGISGKVIDEYTNPSSRATAGHLHVETARQVDVKVMNAAGSNVIVSSSQLAAGGFPQ
jgi:hypothetical protein